MKKTLIHLLAAISVLLWAVACQTTQGSRTYTDRQAQQPQMVYYGTVLKVSEVQIKKEKTGIGAVGGAVVGGIVGSTIGSGRGRTLATTGGALAGAAAGSGAEGAAGTRTALEIEVETDDGRIMVVVQEADDQYAVGDRIRLIEGPDGSVRVRQ